MVGRVAWADPVSAAGRQLQADEERELKFKARAAVMAEVEATVKARTVARIREEAGLPAVNVNSGTEMSAGFAFDGDPPPLAAGK